MERDILSELTPVFREVFNDESLTISRQTTAADVKDWDSLSHIELIVAVEDHFGIKFKSIELTRLDNVGALVDLINAKLPG